MKKPNGASEAALFLCAECPFPVIGGGALRSASLLTFLGQQYSTDLIVFRQPGGIDPADAVPRSLYRRLLVVDLPAHARHPLARAARNARRALRGVPPLLDRYAGHHQPIAAFLAGYHYRWAVIEHFWCAPYHAAVAPYVKQTVLDLHNIESALHQRCALAERGPTRWLHQRFGSFYAALERQWLPRFSHLLVTGAPDRERVLALNHVPPVHIYPNALPLTPLPQSPKQHEIVFSGNLEYVPNTQAVQWFHREIWPLLRQQWPLLRWRIVGQHPHAVQSLIAGDARVDLIGPVPDALPEIARAQVAVVPLLAGSGTRLKILEAWAAGTAVVSTPLGAEGLGATSGTHLLIAGKPAEFAAAISALLTAPERAQQLVVQARCLYEERFTWAAAWQTLPWLAAVEPAPGKTLY